MTCQEIEGWKFDQELGKKLQEKIKEMMREIEESVEPQLPARKLKKSEEKDYTIPAKPFKKDGSLSSVMLKWIDKHNAKVVNDLKIEVYGNIYLIQGGKQIDIKLPMRISNQDDMKDWFLSLGWKPTFFNYLS